MRAKWRTLRLVVAMLTGISSTIVVGGVTPAHATSATERISVSSSEAEANEDSIFSSISEDGSVVAFASSATNLVTGDTNNRQDIFIRDRDAGTTERILGLNGAEPNYDAFEPSISADGNLIAFRSSASNLVFGDTNSRDDIFVYSRSTGTNERVSVNSSEAQTTSGFSYPAISSGGRYVVFAGNDSSIVSGDTNGWQDIFIRDRTEGTTERVSLTSVGGQSNGSSYYSAVSENGRFVAFWSAASNLISSDTNGAEDIFLRDRAQNMTYRISESSSGGQANGWSGVPSISADGRYIVFASLASNLVPNDTNGHADVFVKDWLTGEVMLVSHGRDGNEADGDSLTSTYPSHSISAAGSFVTFVSSASNLVQGDTNTCLHNPSNCIDVFVWDRATDVVTRVSVSSSGDQSNNESNYPSISEDGRHVSFFSFASNLASGDTANHDDVFVRDFVPLPGPPQNLKATPGEHPGEIVLTWGAAVASTSDGTVTNYRIYRGQTSGSETFYQQVGNQTSFTDVDSFGTYFYRVSAVNDGGEGPLSEEEFAVAPKGTVDGFDYPVGKPLDRPTEPWDSDLWYNAQDFGTSNHLGEDWNMECGGDCDLGQLVYAAATGKITYSQDAGTGWGNVVIILHTLPDGTQVETLYGHLEQMSRTKGDQFAGWVRRGEVIGTIGRGRCYSALVCDYTGAAHLHFELRTTPRSYTSYPPWYAYSSNSTGWTDPSNYIDAHRPAP